MVQRRHSDGTQRCASVDLHIKLLPLKLQHNEAAARQHDQVEDGEDERRDSMGSVLRAPAADHHIIHKQAAVEELAAAERANDCIASVGESAAGGISADRCMCMSVCMPVCVVWQHARNMLARANHARVSWCTTSTNHKAHRVRCQCRSAE